MRSTLLLNASYEPLSVVPAQRAVTLITVGRAISLDDSPVTFKHANGEVAIPYVAILRKQVKKKAGVKPPRFSRRGVLIRDGFSCAYCGEYGDTIDHVLPRALGGLSTYDNCVAACRSCNHKKSDRTLATLGWSLKHRPHTPSIYDTMLNKARSDQEAFTAWAKYIGWYSPNVAATVTTV